MFAPPPHKADDTAKREREMAATLAALSSPTLSSLPLPSPHRSSRISITKTTAETTATKSGECNVPGSAWGATKASSKRPMAAAARAAKMALGSPMKADPINSTTASNNASTSSYALHTGTSSMQRSPLAALPPAPRRKRDPKDLWSEISAMEARAAEEERKRISEDQKRQKRELSAALDAHVRSRRELLAEEAKQEEAFSEHVRSAALEFEEEQRAKARRRHEAMLATAAEAEASNRAQMEEKARRQAAELERDRAALARIKQIADADAAKLTEKRKQHLEEVKLQLAQNEVALRSKAEQAKRLREEEDRLVREAAAAAEAREQERLRGVAEREALIQRKLDAMGNVYTAKADADKLAAERADAEAARRYAEADADAKAKAEQRRMATLDTAKVIAQQLELKAQEAREEARRRKDELEKVAAEHAAFVREEQQRKSGRTKFMTDYRASLERQILEDVSGKLKPDEVPLDRSLNASIFRYGPRK